VAYAEITCRDFQKLMLKRKRTIDDLVDICFVVNAWTEMVDGKDGSNEREAVKIGKSLKPTDRLNDFASAAASANGQKRFNQAKFC
jgi:hypothetical protein